MSCMVVVMYLSMIITSNRQHIWWIMNEHSQHEAFFTSFFTSEEAFRRSHAVEVYNQLETPLLGIQRGIFCVCPPISCRSSANAVWEVDILPPYRYGKSLLSQLNLKFYFQNMVGCLARNDISIVLVFGGQHVLQMGRESGCYRVRSTACVHFFDSLSSNNDLSPDQDAGRSIQSNGNAWNYRE